VLVQLEAQKSVDATTSLVPHCMHVLNKARSGTLEEGNLQVSEANLRAGENGTIYYFECRCGGDVSRFLRNYINIFQIFSASGSVTSGWDEIDILDTTIEPLQPTTYLRLFLIQAPRLAKQREFFRSSKTLSKSISFTGFTSHPPFRLWPRRSSRQSISISWHPGKFCSFLIVLKGVSSASVYCMAERQPA
jgi:hypothetical protein